MNAIDVKGLTKRFGSKLVVNNVSISVKKARSWAFLAPTVQAKPQASA